MTAKSRRRKTLKKFTGNHAHTAIEVQERPGQMDLYVRHSCTCDQNKNHFKGEN